MLRSELAVLSRARVAEDGKGISLSVWNYNNGLFRGAIHGALFNWTFLGERERGG